MITRDEDGEEPSYNGCGGEESRKTHSFSLSRKNKVTPYQGKRKRRKVHRGSRNHGVENIYPHKAFTDTFRNLNEDKENDALSKAIPSHSCTTL